MLGSRIGLGEPGEDARGDLRDALLVDLAFEQHQEFVAADAGHRVADTGQLAQALADLAQHGVTAAVSVGVVDRLEAVEVDEQHGQPGRRAVHARHRGGELVLEHQPIGQLREGIVVGDLLQIGVGLAQ